VQWLISTVFGGPTAQAFHDRMHAAGRLLLLTGDLAAYSSARRAGFPATFKQLFPDGSWAAWVPLVAHLYDDGRRNPPGLSHRRLKPFIAAPTLVIPDCLPAPGAVTLPPAAGRW